MIKTIITEGNSKDLACFIHLRYGDFRHNFGNGVFILLRDEDYEILTEEYLEQFIQSPYHFTTIVYKIEDFFDEMDKNKPIYKPGLYYCDGFCKRNISFVEDGIELSEADYSTFVGPTGVYEFCSRSYRHHKNLVVMSKDGKDYLFIDYGDYLKPINSFEDFVYEVNKVGNLHSS